MPFNWLAKFNRQTQKPGDYAEKTLAAYARGMRAGSSLIGVRIELDENSCMAARCLPAEKVYLPDAAPRIPLADCPSQGSCPCVYRPVMDYELGDRLE